MPDTFLVLCCSIGNRTYKAVDLRPAARGKHLPMPALRASTDKRDRRALELLDLIRDKWDCTGMQARLLLLEAMAWVGTFPEPWEIYSARADQSENPDEFLLRVWGPIIEEFEVTTADVRKSDPDLYVAWSNWKRYRESKVNLKKKSDLQSVIDAKVEVTVSKYFNAFRSRVQHNRRKGTGSARG